MKTLACALALGLLMSLAPACSDDSPTPTKDKGVDYKVLPSDSGADTTKDAKLPDQKIMDQTIKPDAISDPSAMQVVISTLTLPKDSDTYKDNIDGDADQDANKLGSVVAVINTMASGMLDLQKELDSQISSAAFTLLLELFANSLVSDSSAKLQFFLGSDLDSDATDNFLGTEQFGIDSQSPTNLVSPGKIASSAMDMGPGNFMIPMPIGTSTTLVSLKLARIKATLSTTPLSAMTSGSIVGAVPLTDIETKLYPAIATLLDYQYKNSTSSQLKTFLQSLDGDKDGTITSTDLKNSSIIGLLLSANVDTDGDKIDDAVAMGLGFTAVKCTIKKN